MNHVYRLKRSGRTQQLQPVPETARSASKGSATTGKTLAQIVGGTLASFALGGIASLAYAQQAPPAVNQLPQGGVVTRGTANINTSTTPAGNALMTVNQASNRAVIDWTSFNVGSQAKVQFNQPSSSAVVLNNILGNNASQIYGQISANGQVFLSNPNGVYFSPTAQVNVGGLVATTGNTNADEFMAGKVSFNRAGSTGSVVNEGQLTSAAGGYIALLAPEVRNQGIVVAQAGTVALASGEVIMLSFNNSGTGLAGITTTPQTIAALVENRSAVLAEGGQIILSAHALAALQGSVVKSSGQLSATSLIEKGGKIVLMADSIELSSTSRIEANGPTGGGTVLVGGDWQGSGDTRQATQVTMAQGASIEANATQNGDGGKVVLWSDVKNTKSLTQVEGRIEARGAGTGNGGQVETSGHVLDTHGIAVLAGSNGGKNGLWLLDPTYSTINAAAVTNFLTSLNGGTDVLNYATNISWTSGVNLLKNAGGDATLTLRAGVDLAIGDTISIASTSGKLNLLLWSGYDSSGSRGVISIGSAAITTNGGHVWAGGGAYNEQTTTWNGLTVSPGHATAFNAKTIGLKLNGTSINTNGGDIFLKGRTANAAGIGTQANNTTLDSGSGNVTLEVGGGVNIGISLEGSTTISGTGDLKFDVINAYSTITKPIKTTGTLTLNRGAGNVTFIADNFSASTFNLTTTGDLTVKPYLASFSSAFSLNSISLGGTPSSLTIGKPGNTADITVNAATSVSGPISLYGGNITINNPITVTSANPSMLTLKASGDIILNANSNISSSNNKLDVVLWSDSDASGQGVIGLHSSIASNGGNIVLAGGADASGLPGGYASGKQLLSGSTYYGIGLNQISLDARIGNALDATAGNITLRGSGTYTSTSASTYAHGISLYGSKLYGNTLTLDGKTTSTSLTGLVTYGISSNGNADPSNTQLNAYGDITLTGTAASPGTLASQNTSQNAIRWGTNHTMASATGNITINATGQLDWYSSQTLTLAAGKALVYNSGFNGTWSNVIAGAGGLTKQGVGALTLSAANTYTGATIISAGTLTLGSAGTIADSSGVTNSGNFTIAAHKTLDSMTGNGSTNLGSYTLTIGDSSNTSATYGGIISGTGGITKAGTGTLTLSGIHAYTGATTISAGTLALDGTGTVATSSGVANSGDFTIAANKTIDSLTGSGTTDLGGSILTVGDASNSSATYNGIISGTGGITKAGTGTLTLLGNNTYSGVTSVSAGTLKAGHDNALGATAGNTVVASGATLSVSDGVDIAEPLQISGAGASGFGALNLLGTNTYSGAVTLSANSTITGGTGTQTLSGHVNGGFGLTVTSSGSWVQSGALGNSTALTSVYLRSSGPASLGAVTATGAIDIATLSGNLTLSNAISTTNATSSAIVLNASKNTNALTSTGGDILVNGGSLSVGAGGRATVYSGSISGSTGLTNLIGSASGRFRYGSDETVSNYTTALNAGLNAIFREQPTASTSALVLSMTYGEALPTITGTGTVNGDATSYSITSRVNSSSGSIKASGTPYVIKETLTGLGYLVNGSSTVSAGTLTVAAKALTMSGLSVTASKVYNGNTSATVSGTATLLSSEAVGSGTSTDGKSYTGDTVSVTGTALGTYNSKDVTSASTVTFSGLSLTGTDASNYSLTMQSPVAATITPKALTISGLSSQDKVYDGTTSASVIGSAALQTAIAAGTGTSSDGKPYAVDGVSLTGSVSGNFNSKDVASANQVTFSGLSLAGTGSSNYTLTPHTVNTTARITPAPLTVTVNDDAKFLVEADRAGFNSVTYSGFVGGETSSVLSGSITITRSNASTNASGTYTGVLGATGLTSSNYSISYRPGSFTITPANQLLIEIANANTAYGTTTQYAINSVKYYNDPTNDGIDNGTVYTLGSGGVAGSSVSINSSNLVNINDGSGGTASFTLAPLSAVYSHANKLTVGSYTLGVSGAVTSNSANFSNTITVTGAHQVNTKGITASASNVSKPYDGTTGMAGVSLNLSTLETNDVVTINGSGAFSDKNVGTGLNYAISNLTLSGSDAGNYHLTGGGSFSGSNGAITSVPLTITANNASKTYDGVAFSGGNGVSYSGFVGSDSSNVLGGSLSYGGTSQGATNAGTGYTIVPSGWTSSNYTISYVSGTLTINPAVVTMTNITGALQGTVSKVYDGTNSAILTSANYALTGWLGSDGAMVTKTSGVYDSANPGGSKIVTVSLSASDYTATGGTNLSNYTLPSIISGAIGVITEAPALPIPPSLLPMLKPEPEVMAQIKVHDTLQSTSYLWPPGKTMAVPEKSEAGLLAVTFLHASDAPAVASAVAFEQDAEKISVKTAAMPLVRPVDDKVVASGKLTEFMVANANGRLVEFMGSMVNGRLVIVAPSDESKQLAKSDANVVLVAAVLALGKGAPIMLAKLNSVVFDLR